MHTPRQQQFINELLQKKTLTKKQREKVIQLLVRDFGSDEELRERVEKIEEVVFSGVTESQILQTNDSNIVEGQDLLDFFGMSAKDSHATIRQKPISGSKPITDEQTASLKPYIDPNKLYQYLFHYNQNPVLRTTCHDMDSDSVSEIIRLCGTESYDFSKHLELILKEFEAHTKSYFGKVVAPQIRAYLTGKDFYGNLVETWSEDKISSNWSSPRLLEWAIANPGVPPNYSKVMLAEIQNEGFEIDQIRSSKTGKVISNFTDLIIHFKHMFHIRYDNSLHNIIHRVNETSGWREKVEFDISEKHVPRNIEHFTDVDKLTQAYDKLLKLICEQARGDDKPRVKIRFYETKNGVNLSIHHLNSAYNKTVQNTLQRIGSTYTDLINRQLNSMCNLYLRADFGDGIGALVNLWDGKERRHIEANGFTGVEHVLAFTKTSKQNIKSVKIVGDDICY